MDDKTGGSVVFLHGAGVGPESWRTQIASLPAGFEGIAPAILRQGNAGDARFSLEATAQSVRDDLDRRGITHAHLCGLSLGAMVATRFALDYPERTASLTLSGGQVRPPRVLMGVQNAIMRVLPARLITPPHMTKRDLLAILSAVGRVDFSSELSRVTAPTLVMCGSKDRPNLKAARQLAANIPTAELQIVPGAGHEWNTQLPNAFSARLNQFLLRTEG